MLHESKKLEQRFAYKQQVINSLEQSMSLKIPSIGNEQVIMSQGIYSGLANGSSFNDVAEFEIYDRKFSSSHNFDGSLFDLRGTGPQQEQDLLPF